MRSRTDFIKFCKKYGKINLRTRGPEIHYSVPITDETETFLEEYFKFAEVSTIYSFGQPVGIKYQKADCVWEEYAAEFDCSYSLLESLPKLVFFKQEVLCEAY